MDFVIKKVILQEAAKVTAIIHEALQKDFPYKQEAIAAHIRIYNEKYFFKVLEDQKNSVFGAYKSEELVGVIVLKPEMGGVLFVDWLIVREEYREEGIGSKLLEKTDEWALEQKCHYAYLYTETDKNIKYYEKRGFKYIGKHENAWFGETEHLLGKQLREEPFPEAFQINPV